MALTEEQKQKLQEKAQKELALRQQREEIQNIDTVNKSIFMEAKVSMAETAIEAKVSLLALVPCIVIAFIVFLIGRKNIGMSIFLCALIIGIPFIRIRCIELSVTNKKVIGKTGVFSGTRMESPLDQVSNVSVEQGIIGTALNYGTVVISTDSGMYYFKYIKDPDDFQSDVMDMIHKYKEDYATRQAVKIAMAMREAGMKME